MWFICAATVFQKRHFSQSFHIVCFKCKITATLTQFKAKKNKHKYFTDYLASWKPPFRSVFPIKQERGSIPSRMTRLSWRESADLDANYENISRLRWPLHVPAESEPLSKAYYAHVSPVTFHTSAFVLQLQVAGKQSVQPSLQNRLTSRWI